MNIYKFINVKYDILYVYSNCNFRQDTTDCYTDEFGPQVGILCLSGCKTLSESSKPQGFEIEKCKDFTEKHESVDFSQFDQFVVEKEDSNFTCYLNEIRGWCEAEENNDIQVIVSFIIN